MSVLMPLLASTYVEAQQLSLSLQRIVAQFGPEGLAQQFYNPDPSIPTQLVSNLRDILAAAPFDEIASFAYEVYPHDHYPSSVYSASKSGPSSEAGPSNLNPQHPPTPQLDLPDELVEEDALARSTLARHSESSDDEKPVTRKGKGKARAR